jgi:enterochelin esterase family protein
VRLTLADPDRRFAAVRLCADLPLDGAFARAGGDWELELEDPPVDRLEYELEVEHADGTSERIRDPANDRAAPGAFGDKSELWLRGYAPPAWLEAPAVGGASQDVEVHGRGLGATVRATLWSPEGSEEHDALPLLVAHDGPEYDRLAQLTRFSAAAIASEALPPHRVALLAPGQRDEWYSASARYATALVHDVLPAVRGAVAVHGPLAGMGASLGGLAMLHAHRTQLGVFGALFLQSSSFFLPRFDAHESGFPRYKRIVRFVRAVLRDDRGHRGRPVPAVLTCGSAEENLHNNRVVAHALAEQGYGAPLHEVADLHNFTAWRDAFDPHLTELLQRVWAP